ncbi:STAS domain-containing protein [Nocardia sp. NPDC052001]|uniref:STAS domain-containing protein n=1 Tax=Nocardia sp. NPDC052001 TaxID=3154853 RepID=UPI00341D3688
MSGEAAELTLGTRNVGAALVLSASGEIDVVSAPKLSAALAEAAASESPVLVVDLARVRFIGSVGLSVLLEARESASNRTMKVVASPQVRRPIEITGLDIALDVYDSLDQALSDA